MYCAVLHNTRYEHISFQLNINMSIISAAQKYEYPILLNSILNSNSTHICCVFCEYTAKWLPFKSRFLLDLNPQIRQSRTEAAQNSSEF